MTGAEFVKRADTISIHEQQLMLHRDTLHALKANIDNAEAEILKLQKTLNGMAPEGNIDFTGFTVLLEQHDENYKDISHQLGKDRELVQNL